MNSKTNLSILFALIMSTGCSMGKDLAQSTRTGKIHDIRIGQSVEPKDIEVRAGDEVRWVNGRKAPVKVVFIDSLQDHILCQKNFKLTSKTTTSNIDANDYASLCFMSPGAYTYNTRMESPAPGGEMNAVGRVLVE